VDEDLSSQVPEGFEFSDLPETGDSCRCDGWRLDADGVYCMYYDCAGRKARVSLAEVEAAADHIVAGNAFDHAAFGRLCPAAHQAGGNAYVVIGRILEEIFGAEYAGQDGFASPD